MTFYSVLSTVGFQALLQGDKMGQVLIPVGHHKAKGGLTNPQLGLFCISSVGYLRLKGRLRDGYGFTGVQGEIQSQRGK